ncbi:MAG: MotE family protein [Nitrospinales bacterium]
MNILQKNFYIIFILMAFIVLLTSSGYSHTSEHNSEVNTFAKGKKPQLPHNISTTNPETLRLLEIIERKNKDLERRETELLAKEENLKTLELKIREDLQMIEKAMIRSEELAGAKKGMIEENISSLAKVYSSMKPAQAAAILDTVDESIALHILSRMKSRNSGRILGKMNRAVAKNISERLAGKFAEEEKTIRN